MKKIEKQPRKALSEEDREILYEMHKQQKGFREIGRRLNRCHSIISREISRNEGNSYEWQKSSGLSRGRMAHARAKSRLRSSRKRERLKNRWIRKVVENKLKVHHWSPELISGYLKKNHPRLYICTESIYQWISNDRPDLKKYLFCGGKKYRKNRVKKKRPSNNSAVPRKSIHSRSNDIENRTSIGNWEGDAIVCRQNTAALINVVERVSRYLKIEKVHDCTGKSGKKAFSNIFSKIPSKLLITSTFDHGSENSLFYELEEEYEVEIHFCDPGRPDQKGSIENRNRFVRHFIPKGTDISKVSLVEIERIVEIHNNRPMKCLGFKTPQQVYSEAVKSLNSSCL